MHTSRYYWHFAGHQYSGTNWLAGLLWYMECLNTFKTILFTLTLHWHCTIWLQDCTPSQAITFIHISVDLSKMHPVHAGIDSRRLEPLPGQAGWMDGKLVWISWNIIKFTEGKLDVHSSEAITDAFLRALDRNVRNLKLKMSELETHRLMWSQITR